LYLATALIVPAAAKLFVFRTSNLPPSKEGGEGDCGRGDLDGCLTAEGGFGKASAFYLPSLVPARPD